MLTRIKLSDFKCFDTVAVDLRPFNVLVGPNNSGKSSFLSAFTLLTELCAKQFDEVRKLLDSSVRVQSDGKSFEIGVESNHPSASYDVAVSIADSLPCLVSESLVVDNVKLISMSGSNATAGRKQESLSMDQYRGSTLLQSVNGMLLDRVLGRLPYHSARYQLDPERLSQASSVASGPSPTLNGRGENLPTVLDYLLGVERDAFVAIEEGMRSLFPRLRSLLISPAATSGASAKSVSFKEHDGTIVPAALASDGMLLVLGYLTIAHAPNSPNILLIEEPENGVHPKALERVVRTLRSISQPSNRAAASQVILTTHSPYLLDHVRPEEILVSLRPDNGSPSIERLHISGKFQTELRDYLMGELWYNLGEENILKLGTK